MGRSLGVMLCWIPLVWLCTLRCAADWPHLGSPDLTTVGVGAEPPQQFDPATNAAWKVELPGPGSSTPSVHGDRIFITCELGEKNALLCLGTDGNERWRQTIGTTVQARHRNATSANPSPIANDQQVVAYFKDTTLGCYSLDGIEQWQVNLNERYGKVSLWWDLGNSPVLTSAGVLLSVMHEGDSYLVTLDLASGEEVWRQPRQYDCAEESEQSYTTPLVATIEGIETVLSLGANHLTAHNTATGELLWEENINPENHAVWRTIASPALAENVALVPYGRGDYLCGVQLTADPPAGSARRLWTLEGTGSDVPTPLIHQRLAYILGDKGKVTCLDVATGEPLWSDSLPRGRGKYFSSPLIAGDSLYCAREDGMLYTCKFNDGLSVTQQSDLQEQLIATPVLLGNDLLIRTRGHLYRFTATP